MTGDGFLRKFGVNKKNPNPPWPKEKSAVIVPPGSGALAVGITDDSIKAIPVYEYTEGVRNSSNNNAYVAEDQREYRQEPIMGNMYNNRLQQNNTNNNLIQNMSGVCGNINVAKYLCAQIGKQVKLEFLFGENTHMEKTGRLKNVGKDFVAIQENGTNNVIVCSMNKVKFINIYGYGV